MRPVQEGIISTDEKVVKQSALDSLKKLDLFNQLIRLNQPQNSLKNV